MITLFVGDTGSYLADAAHLHDKSAILITSKNIAELTNATSGTYYTSLGDLSGLLLPIAMDIADEIIYLPPDKWTDSIKSASPTMKELTEFCCLYFNDKKTVQNIRNLVQDDEISNMLMLADHRKTKSKQMWSVGCSITHGCDIPINLRYGQLLANQLNLDVSFLTQSGSSNEWAADQILRSDIKKNDIVIWGLTSFDRFPYYNKQTVSHITNTYYLRNAKFRSIVPIEMLDDMNNVYKNISSIHQVINYCKKVGADLILAGILVSSNHLPYITNLSNFTQLHGIHGLRGNGGVYLDLGTDNKHPGVITHQWYADQICSKIKKLGLV